MFPTTVVVWDLNTCPVPERYDPGHVRPSIEWALIKRFGLGRVTVFGVGNLEHVSPRLLKDISSSGILLRHGPGAGTDVVDLFNDWQIRTPPPANVLLITRDTSWQAMGNITPGYTLLHAFPNPLSLYDYKGGDRREWFWESILQANLGLVETSTSQTHKDEDAWFCTVCMTSYQSCDDFINHFKSQRHKYKSLAGLPSLDENNNPTLFCKLCEYPGYDRWNMYIHYDSEEHAQKEREEESRRGSSEKEAPLFYQQPNTTQEEDFANSSLEQGGQEEIKMAGEGEVIAHYSINSWNEWLKAAKESKKLIVIHFTATWLDSLYPPSLLIPPIFAEYAKKFLNVVFLEANVDVLGNVAEEFGVQKLPTFTFMRQDKILDKVVRPKVVGGAIDEIRVKLEMHSGSVASA